MRGGAIRIPYKYLMITGDHRKKIKDKYHTDAGKEIKELIRNSNMPGSWTVKHELLCQSRQGSTNNTKNAG